MHLQSFQAINFMDVPLKSKRMSKKSKKPQKNLKVVQQKSSPQHKPKIFDQIEKQDQIRQFFIVEMIKNDEKRERILDNSIQIINLVVKFSQKFSLTMNLPLTLTIFQLNQIISSYSRLHLKNCSSRHSYAGMYVATPFERKDMIELFNNKEKKSLQKKDEIECLALQVLEFIHQNSLLSQQINQLDQKQLFNGIRTHKVQTIANLFSIKQKIYSEHCHYEKELEKIYNCVENILPKQKNFRLKVFLKYDSTSKLVNFLGQNKNKVESFEMPLFFKKDNMETLKEESISLKMQNFTKNLDNLELFEPQQSPKQNIYIKEYTQASEISQLQSDRSLNLSQQIEQSLEESRTNFITFDPKQILDSGRFKAPNKSIQSFMNWFNKTEIADFLLIKYFIFQGKSFSQNISQSKQFMQFPLRLRGSSKTYELYVIYTNKMKINLLSQMNQLIKKIISSDISVNFQINHFYFLQSNRISAFPKQKQQNIKRHKDIKKQKETLANPQNCHIFIAETSPFQQLTLIQYIQNFLKTVTTRGLKDLDLNSLNFHLESIRKFIYSILCQAEDLLKQLIQFGRLLVDQCQKQNVYNININKLNQRNIMNKLNESKQYDNNENIIKLFQTSQFWQICQQQKHHFIKDPNHQRFCILPIFICKKVQSKIQKIQLCINFPQLIKRIISFYQQRNQNKFINRLPQKRKNDENHFMSLLNTRLKTQFTSIVKEFSKDLNLNQVWNLNHFTTQNQNQQNKRNKPKQINFTTENILKQVPFANILFSLTASFLKRISKLNQNFVQTVVQEEKQKEQSSVFNRLNDHFNSYHSLKSQKFCQLRSHLCKSIQIGSYRLHELFTRPKSLYFSSGEALDLYQKETTLKKKKQSQSTSHKNSIDLHRSVQITKFNHSECKNLSQSVLSNIYSNSNFISNQYQKPLYQKDNLKQNKSIKSDKNVQKNSKQFKKDQKTSMDKKN